MGVFWNSQVLSFSKLSLLLIFGQVEAEIFEVKDTRGHNQFSHNYARFFRVLALGSLVWIFKNSMLKLLRKSIKVIWKCENWKWPLVSLTSNISASTLPNVKSKDSFKSSEQADFKTYLTFWIWPSRSWDIAKNNKDIQIKDVQDDFRNSQLLEQLYVRSC